MHEIIFFFFFLSSFKAPYNSENSTFESNIVSYWVVPPPENRIHEYGKPMMMSYSVLQDQSISHDVLLEMVSIDFYFFFFVA